MQLRKTTMIITMGVALLAISTPSAYCADVAKIGTVSFQRIFKNSEAGKTVKEKINSEGQRMEQDLQQKGEEIKALKNQIQQGAEVMSKEASDEKKWEFDRKMSDVQRLKKKYDQKIQELQMKLVNEVREGVLEVIKDYGKKEGYLLIIEDISVVYAPENLDITDTIIKLYNEAYTSQGKKN
ncbi:MAG: OmpH family outer membrane protein [Desulfatitalea sp.]|nr:OmpH family outer membrane protein [Desulfatitalea sp.]NNK01997.1 OmpH family outer membrane protein [Desulfatitalea sp.]